MRAYGLKKADVPQDCTSTGKFGNSKLRSRCSCGAYHGYKSKDYKSRKAHMRRAVVGEGEE